MQNHLSRLGNFGRYPTLCTARREYLNVDSATDEGRKVPSKRLSFSVSNLLMLVALTAISMAWWVDRNRSSPPQGYDIPGPIFVSYKVRTSPSSTSGGNISGVTGINCQGGNIIVYTENGGTVMAGNSLIEFTWKSE
jgi:hypothetical protein